MIPNVSSYNNNYPISEKGINREDVQGTLIKSSQAASDNFESNSAVKAVSGSSDPKVMQKTLLLTAPLVLLDKFINKLIGGSEESSLLNKLAKAGDKISSKLHLDNVLSQHNTSRISDFLKNNRFTKYFTNDFKAIPKSSFAKSESMQEKAISQAVNAMKKYKESGADLGKFFGKETVEYIENGSGTAKNIADDLIAGLDKIIAGGTESVGEKNLLKGKVSLSEISNKLKATSSKFGKSVLGKNFAKGALKSKDVLTMGGGLLGLGFAANAIVQATKAAKEAPKGEKKSTFMHVLSENYIGLALFQPSMNILYKFGGNKYRGMTVEGREALKELIQKTNADQALTKEGYKIAQLQKKLLLKGVDKNKVKTLSGKTLEEAKNLFGTLKGEGTKLKFWEKPLKKVASILTMGLDSLKNPKLTGKIGKKLKGFGGGFMRFAVIMFAIQPFIQKPFTKLMHKIFGEPKTYLEKEKSKENENEPGVNNGEQIVSSDTQSADPSVNVDPNMPVNNTTSQNGTNLINQWTGGVFADQSSNGQNIQVTPQAENNQGNNSGNNPVPALNIAKNPGNNSYTGYIPSINVENDKQAGAQKEAAIEQQANEILKSTDSLIADAKKIL